MTCSPSAMGSASRGTSTDDEVLEHIPTLEREGLRGGVMYYDGQFDDARLLINLAQTAEEQGAVLLNYAPVIGLTHDAEGFVDGVDVHGPGIRRVAHDSRPLRHQRHRRVQRCDPQDRRSRAPADDRAEPGRAPDAGRGRSWPATPRSWFRGRSDGRVMFAIPWHEHTLLGTTDTPIESATSSRLRWRRRSISSWRRRRTISLAGRRARTS